VFTTTASSVQPVAMMGNAGIAGAGLRNYALELHQARRRRHLRRPCRAGPVHSVRWWRGRPDALAERYFERYERRDQPEIKVGNYIAQALANASP
jgi:hypothetical protein